MPESQPQTCNFIKKRLWHRCFLRTPFLQETSDGCFWIFCTYFRKQFWMAASVHFPLIYFGIKYDDHIFSLSFCQIVHTNSIFSSIDSLFNRLISFPWYFQIWFRQHEIFHSVNCSTST